MFVVATVAAVLGLLSSANSFQPHLPFGRQSFALKALSSGSRALRERLETHPQLSSLLRSQVAQYGICTALAEECMSTGAFEEAEGLAREAIAAAAETKEVDNIYAAFAKGILASAYYAEERYEEAANEYREALKAYEQHYSGETTPDIVEQAGASQLLTWTLVRNEQYDEAVEAGRQALGYSLRLFGRNSTEVAGALVNLGSALLETGDMSAQTEALLKEARSIYGTGEDVDVNGYVLASCTLGQLYLFRGDSAAAEVELAKAAVCGGFMKEIVPLNLKEFLYDETEKQK